MISEDKVVILRCEDNAEAVVFVERKWPDGDIDYEINVEDAYCGGDFMGIKGRFERAWKAFWAKPIFYTGVYCEDKNHIKKFLEDCLKVIHDSTQTDEEEAAE